MHEHSLCFHWSSIYTKCTLVSFFFLMFCNIIEWFYRLSLALSMPVAAASLTETVKVNILSHPFFFLVLHATRGFASLLPCKCQSQKWSEPVGMDRYIAFICVLSLLFTSISDIEQKNCWHLQQILCWMLSYLLIVTWSASGLRKGEESPTFCTLITSLHLLVQNLSDYRLS